jgi:hypothetical protein
VKAFAGLRRLLLLLALLATASLAACNSDGITDPNMPRLGRYSYRVDHHHSGNYDGILVITFASADSIAGGGKYRLTRES